MQQKENLSRVKRSLDPWTERLIVITYVRYTSVIVPRHFYRRNTRDTCDWPTTNSMDILFYQLSLKTNTPVIFSFHDFCKRNQSKLYNTLKVIYLFGSIRVYYYYKKRVKLNESKFLNTHDRSTANFDI